MATGAGQAESPGWEVFAQWHALIDARDPRFTLLSTVQDVAGTLVRFEATITQSTWNMQRHHTVDALRDPLGLDASGRRKGLELRFILPRRVAQQRSPLASSYYDYLRLAPVAHPLMIGDRRQILVGDSTGETVWTSSDAEVVARAVDFYERLWASAEPAVPVGDEPPFTRRMVDIALLLVTGATDREIAQALGVSERTVSSDVRELSARLGARSRAQAIAMISGAAG